MPTYAECSVKSRYGNPSEFAHWRKMAGYRNRLVHVYPDVDDHLLDEFLRTRLGDLDRFQGEVLKFLA